MTMSIPDPGEAYWFQLLELQKPLNDGSKRLLVCLGCQTSIPEAYRIERMLHGNPPGCPRCGGLSYREYKRMGDLGQDDDFGWWCPVHGYHLNGSPDRCIDAKCGKFVAITEEDRVAYEDLCKVKLPYENGATVVPPSVRALLTEEAKSRGEDDTEAVKHVGAPHYRQHPSGVECRTIAEPFGFNLGNAVKYIWRLGLKDSAAPAHDLKKAIRYLQFELEKYE